jgi:hypothetical protein
MLSASPVILSNEESHPLLQPVPGNERFFASAQNDGWTVRKMANEDAIGSYVQKDEAHLSLRGGLKFFG